MPCLLSTLLCAPLFAAPADPGPWAVASTLDEFLGEQVFVAKQQLWEKRGGWGGVITTPAGTVLVFRAPGGTTCRRSVDGGLTWSDDIEIGPDAKSLNAIIDESTGDVLCVNPGAGCLYRSQDDGLTWTRETIEVRPDKFGLTPKTEGTGAMQCGITLAFGEHQGRLIMPARIMGPQNSNAVEWRPYHYSTAIFSDDQGATWQVSNPFPVMGTGEATLAELSDGRILYNSREHMSRGNRFFAWSDNGGELWINASRSPDLPDGDRGTSYGLMGGMLRLPVAGQDILIYSNVDNNVGQMPKQVGASIVSGRARATVWASFDGGQSWPVKRLVDPGPSAYSNLGVGRHGTPSEGKIYLVYEGSETDPHGAVQVVAFNLAWLLDGQDVARLLPQG